MLLPGYNLSPPSCVPEGQKSLDTPYALIIYQILAAFKKRNILFYIFNFDVSIGDASVVKGADSAVPVLPRRAAARVG